MASASSVPLVLLVFPTFSLKEGKAVAKFAGMFQPIRAEIRKFAPWYSSLMLLRSIPHLAGLADTLLLVLFFRTISDAREEMIRSRGDASF